MIHFNCLESAEMIMRGRFTDQGGLFSYIAPDKWTIGGNIADLRRGEKR
jgi:hypothetical protein